MLPLLITHLLLTAGEIDACPEDFTVEAESISFGEAVVGGSVSLTIGVHYSGSTTLGVTSNNDAFALSAGTRLGTTVHQVPITFAPTHDGPVSAVVAFESEHCSRTIEVNGTGLDGAASSEDADDAASCSSAGASSLTTLALGCFAWLRAKRAVLNQHHTIAA